MKATHCSVSDCTKPDRTMGWCAMHYERYRQHGTLADPVKLTVDERFMRFVAVDEDSGCWLWQGHIQKYGYGHFGWKHADGRWGPRRAHRVAYELFVGPIPDGLTIDHLCGVRHCVNPAHLRAVTQRVNTLRNSSPAAVNARAASCRRGHPLSGENLQIINSSTGVKRRCKECARARRVARRLGDGGEPA